MKTEIFITRLGATGYSHEVRVRVELHDDGGYDARVAEDVPRMHESTRYAEPEWEQTAELEFAIRDRVTLSRAEIAEAKASIGAVQEMITREKGRLAA